MCYILIGYKESKNIMDYMYTVTKIVLRYNRKEKEKNLNGI